MGADRHRRFRPLDACRICNTSPDLSPHPPIQEIPRSSSREPASLRRCAAAARNFSRLPCLICPVRDGGADYCEWRLSGDARRLYPLHVHPLRHSLLGTTSRLLALSRTPPSRYASLSGQPWQFWRQHIILGSGVWNPHPTSGGALTGFVMGQPHLVTPQVGCWNLRCNCAAITRQPQLTLRSDCDAQSIQI